MPEIEPMKDIELNALRGAAIYLLPEPAPEVIRRLIARLIEAEAERDRYKAVVDKLPKTADNVPVVPGYTSVHRVNRFGSCGTYHLMSLDCGRWVLSCDSRIKVSDCYSTREAAEAALQATNAESQEDTDAK